MGNRFIIPLALVVVVGIITFGASFYTVPETEQVLIEQFGRIVTKKPVNEPGLHWKVPFVQGVIRFDKRLLGYDVPTDEVTTRGQKQMVVNAYVRYRITDPLKFYRVARTRANWTSDLNGMVISSMRQVFKSATLAQVMSDDRSSLMAEVTKLVRNKALGRKIGDEPVVKGNYGVYIVDVRMKRVDLTDENSKAVYDRMVAGRKRVAEEFRAEGARKGREILAKTNRQKAEATSEADRKAALVKGKADAAVIKTYNEAYGKDKNFFDFWRSMEALKRGLKPGTATFVGKPEGDFFRYFNNEMGNPPQK